MEGDHVREEGETAGQQSQQAWKKTNTVFTNAKAGMQGVDKDRVKKVIYEMSKNSPHFRNEQRKQRQTEERISRLLSKAKSLGAQELAGHARRMDDKIAKLVAERDLTRTWVHVDMDAFFASVEELHDPSLKSVPMGVGGIGMLSTTNYIARKYGVRSAMPGFIALKLCPELVFVKPNFQRYSEASRAVKDILRQYDTDLDSASLDEAHLDITDYCKANNLSGVEVAAEMRQKVLDATRLTCSCGIAPNRMLAKVCSDMNKPNGQYNVQPDPDLIQAFMAPLPIRKIPGIGKVAEQLLNALGIQTCADVLRMRGSLSALFSEITTDFTLSAALGLGGTSHHPPAREGQVSRKGMGVERTFAVISQPKDLEAKCCELAAKLAEDMEEESLKAKTLTLKLKPPTFELKTRAITLPMYISTEEEIRSAALGLLRAELPISVRLMGLRMSSFLQTAADPGQQSVDSFFKPKGEKSNQEADHDEQGLFDENEDPKQIDKNEDLNQGDSTDEQVTLQGRTKSSSYWECQHCTFAENSHHFLRCMVCDSRKGTAPQYRESEEGQAQQLQERSTLDNLESSTMPMEPSYKPKSSDTQKEADSSSTMQHADHQIAFTRQEAERQQPVKVLKTERQNMRKRKQPDMNRITRFFSAPSSKT